MYFEKFTMDTRNKIRLRNILNLKPRSQKLKFGNASYVSIINSVLPVKLRKNGAARVLFPDISLDLFNNPIGR
jgi:hypothetical protein